MAFLRKKRNYLEVIRLEFIDNEYLIVYIS